MRPGMPGPKGPRQNRNDLRNPKTMGRKNPPIPSDVARNRGEGESPAPTADRIEGRNPVLEAMRAGRTFNKIFVAQRQENSRPDPTMARIINMAKDLHIPIVEVPKASLDDMSQTHNHQGVVAQVASHEYVGIDEMLDRAAEKGEAPLLLILDELKDAYNLGSILRIADAAGVHGVIIPQHRSIGLDSMVAKASAGAIEYVPVARVTNLSRTILELKDKGFWIAGTDAEGTNEYYDDVWSGPMAIVIGSEGEGMSKNIREKCDFLLSIPMAGSVNSLNAAVAAGIVVFEAVKQRRKDT